MKYYAFTMEHCNDVHASLWQHNTINISILEECCVIMEHCDVTREYIVITMEYCPVVVEHCGLIMEYYDITVEHCRLIIDYCDIAREHLWLYKFLPKITLIVSFFSPLSQLIKPWWPSYYPWAYVLENTVMPQWSTVITQHYSVSCHMKHCDGTMSHCDSKVGQSYGTV